MTLTSRWSLQVTSTHWSSTGDSRRLARRSPQQLSDYLPCWLVTRGEAE